MTAERRLGTEADKQSSRRTGTVGGAALKTARAPPDKRGSAAFKGETGP